MNETKLIKDVLIEIKKGDKDFLNILSCLVELSKRDELNKDDYMNSEIKEDKELSLNDAYRQKYWDLKEEYDELEKNIYKKAEEISDRTIKVGNCSFYISDAMKERMKRNGW